MTPLASDLGPELATRLGNQFSPSVLAESLILLAQEADRSGYRRSADRLIAVAHAALDE